MEDITKELLREWTELYRSTNIEFFKDYISRFKKRNASCYKISSLNDIIDCYDIISENQHWPFYATPDQYIDMLDPEKNQLTEEQISFLQLSAPDKDCLEEPVHLIHIEDASVANRYSFYGIYTYHFKDFLQQDFFVYSVRQPMIDYIHKNSSTKFTLLLHPTPQRIVDFKKNTKSPLFSAIYASPDVNDGDIKKVTEDLVLV